MKDIPKQTCQSWRDIFQEKAVFSFIQIRLSLPVHTLVNISKTPFQAFLLKIPSPYQTSKTGVFGLTVNNSIKYGGCS